MILSDEKNKQLLIQVRAVILGRLAVEGVVLFVRTLQERLANANGSARQRPWWIVIQYRQLAENGAFFIPLSYSAPLLPIFPLEFRGEVMRQETRVMGLLCGEVAWS